MPNVNQIYVFKKFALINQLDQILIPFFININ